MEIKPGASYGDAYGLAMAITDQAEADAYFAALVRACVREGMVDEAEATKIVRHNLGYYAGYYGNSTRERVERLFHTAHPIFGAIAERGAPSPLEAFEMGIERGKKQS